MLNQSHDFTADPLKNLPKQLIDALMPLISNEIKKQVALQSLTSKEILTFEEAAIYLRKSQSDLYKMTSARKLRHMKPGGKVIFFERADLDNWMRSNPVETLETISLAAISSVKINNRRGK